MALIGFAAFAQTGTISTGNGNLDAYLAKLDKTGTADSSSVLAQLANKFQVSASTLETLAKEGYKPGEIMFALELSKSSGKSLGQVIALAKGKGHEWGLVAQSLGIKPGSAEFETLVGKSVDDAVKIKGTETETETEAQSASGQDSEKKSAEAEGQKEGSKVEGSGHDSGSSEKD